MQLQMGLDTKSDWSSVVKWLTCGIDARQSSPLSRLLRPADSGNRTLSHVIASGHHLPQHWLILTLIHTSIRNSLHRLNDIEHFLPPTVNFCNSFVVAVFAARCSVCAVVWLDSVTLVSERSYKSAMYVCFIFILWEYITVLLCVPVYCQRTNS
jgi:hypothetical protein